MTPEVAVQPVGPDSKPGLVSFWPVPVQAAGLTVQVNDVLAVPPAESVTVTVTALVAAELIAAAVGVPEITPLDVLIVRPAGRPEALQV